jgi:iron complex outermembrane receptor protein
MRRSILLACLIALPALAQEPVATEPAPAAEQAPADAKVADKDAATVTLEEVEVTALRRKDKLQNVPVAVTAMTQDQVEARRITRIDDLNSLAPGLQVSRSPSNSTISQLTIRGSSQINPAIYWDPAVGVYLDGVYIGKSQGSIFDVVDLANVEVLRGPQGTLYGRNTIGGTINLITRDPTGQFSGNAAAEIGNYNARVFRASVDLPRLWIADITLSARSERRDGWIETIQPSSVSELNNRHADAVHGALNLLLLDSLEGRYRFDLTNVNQTNVFDQLYRSDDPTLADYVHTDRQEQAQVNAPSLERSKLQGHSFTLSWFLGDNHTVKSITGYREVEWVDFLDLDGSPNAVAHTKRLTDYEQFSEDLQALGHFGDFYYTAGLFYFSDDGYTNNPQTFENGALNFDSQYGTQTKAVAGYGQLDWRLLEPLTLSAGVRYTRERKGLDRILGASTIPGSIPDGLPELPVDLPGPPIDIGPGSPAFVYYIVPGYHVEETFAATTPMFSVAWRPAKTVNFYLRYAEGFKSGGFNGEYSNLQDRPHVDGAPPNDSETATSIPFRPERQKSLELGSKLSFFGGKALLNVAAFRNKLVDLQISTFTGQGAAASTISNAGKATVHGVEIETAVVPFDGTQLRANYAYLHAKYDEFRDSEPNPDFPAPDPDNPTLPPSQTRPCNCADNRAFVHAPEHTFNVVLDSVMLRTSFGSLRGIVDYVWTDSMYLYPYQLETRDPMKQTAANTQVKAYGLLNAKLALTTIPLGRSVFGEIAVWGRNLTDDATAYNFIDFGPGAFQNLTVANFVEPRAYGATVAVRW